MVAGRTWNGSGIFFIPTSTTCNRPSACSFRRSTCHHPRNSSVSLYSLLNALPNLPTELPQCIPNFYRAPYLRGAGGLQPPATTPTSAPNKSIVPAETSLATGSFSLLWVLSCLSSPLSPSFFHFLFFLCLPLLPLSSSLPLPLLFLPLSPSPLSPRGGTVPHPGR